MEDTGPVTCISWTPDNCAFAVGWKFRGLTVWSVSGCRLMCTIRQTGSNSASSPMVKPSALKFEPLMGGTSHIQWDDYGYKLFAVEENLSERILAFSFAKCCLNRGLSGTTYTRQILYGEDRILLVQPDDTDELKMLHLNVPVKCLISSNLFRRQKCLNASYFKTCYNIVFFFLEAGILFNRIGQFFMLFQAMMVCTWQLQALMG